jgi:tryptophanase
VIEVILNVFEKREKLRGMKITWQPEVLRHFTAQFEYDD